MPSEMQNTSTFYVTEGILQESITPTTMMSADSSASAHCVFGLQLC